MDDMSVSDLLSTVLIVIAVVLIISGTVWFLSTLGSIPAWGWLIIIGSVLLVIFYIIVRMQKRRS